MVQQVEMTQEEKLKMYMKLSKKELAKMLIERDRLDELKSYPITYFPYTTNGTGFDCGCKENEPCWNTACPRKTHITYSTNAEI